MVETDPCLHQSFYPKLQCEPTFVGMRRGEILIGRVLKVPRISPSNYIKSVQVRRQLDALFADPNVSTIKFESFINERLHMCNNADIASLMRLSGKRLKSGTLLTLKSHLPLIAHRLKELTTSRWMFMHMSFIIYGLQSLYESDSGYLDILCTMSKVAEDLTRRGRMEVTPQNISMLFYGLQNNRCHEYESRCMISNLAELIGTCEFNLDAQAFGNTLCGLQGMSSDRLEVAALISALTPTIQRCKDPLDAQAVGNALYGLQGMSSGSKEVRALLSALLPKVQKCAEKLRSQHIGNALYGLQRMSSDSQEVRALLFALVPKIQSCKENLSAQNIGNALYGLQGMSSENDEVAALLSALVAKVQSCDENLNAQAVGNALYGLQRMNSECSEVTALLSALVPRICSCKEALNAQAVGNAIYGLQGLKSVSSTHLLLEIFRLFLDTLCSSSSQLEKLPIAHIMDLARSIALSHSLLIDSGISASEKVWMNINGSLHKELARRHQNEPEVTSFRSPAEERTYAIACKILKLSDISISSNEYLLGLFESDIVIRIPLSKTLHSDHKYLIINIEVDGLHHKQSTRKRFCHLRDKYLVSKGLIVERIETLRLRNMSNTDIEEWILQIVASTLLGSTKR